MCNATLCSLSFRLLLLRFNFQEALRNALSKLLCSAGFTRRPPLHATSFQGHIHADCAFTLTAIYQLALDLPSQLVAKTEKALDFKAWANQFPGNHAPLDLCVSVGQTLLSSL